jgi:heterodisulfide reductase subunit C
MHIIPQLIFAALLAMAGYFIFRSISRIRFNILLGKSYEPSSYIPARWMNMTLTALGQKKMFKKPLPAVLHLFIYLGFLIVNVEMLEIVLDGLLGTHRLFAAPLGSFYPFIINVFEFFAVAVIIACVVFLVRRNMIHVKRFSGKEMTQWPTLDANLILIIEIVLMVAFLTMNASDQLLQGQNEHYKVTGHLAFSALLMPLFSSFSAASLMILERSTWWVHIIGVMLFANYVFYNSKHLHIFFAFLNTYYARLVPQGEIDNMSSVTKEVQLMLGLTPTDNTPTDPSAPMRFGAKDVQDLSWKNLMDAYSCTECGRCTEQCPANITGKLLSPRKIMMDTRDRLEEVGKNIRTHGVAHQDNKSLFDYISEEEILACTTCNACVEACPVQISPVEIIVEMRRYKVMEESKAPGSWNAMFSNIENNFAPWKFSPSDRFNWSDKL